MRNIYINKDDGRYYKILRKGEGRFSGMYLWKRMRKFLWFYIPTKHEFWLDDYGFIIVY